MSVAIVRIRQTFFLNVNFNKVIIEPITQLV